MRWLFGIALAAGRIGRQAPSDVTPSVSDLGVVTDAAAPLGDSVLGNVGALTDSLLAGGACSCECCMPVPPGPAGEKCIVEAFQPPGRNCPDPCMPMNPEVIAPGTDGVELLRFCVVECQPQLSGTCTAAVVIPELAPAATLAPTPEAVVPTYEGADAATTPKPSGMSAADAAAIAAAKAAMAAAAAAAADISDHTDAASAAADNAEAAVEKIQATVADIENVDVK